MTLFLKNLLFTLVVPGTVGVYVPLFLARGDRTADDPGFVVALALFAAGAAIYAWTVWDFATTGRGTPAPIDAPKTLVVRGLYRQTRNPMYVGVLTVLMGWLVMYRSLTLLVYSICIAVLLHLFIVLYEERHLARVFGAEYRDYCANVGRWLPRLRAHDPA